MTDHQTLADLYASLDPAELTTDQLLTYTLIGEVMALRTDVVVERKERQESFLLVRAAIHTAVIGILAIVLVLGGGAIAWVRQGQISCETRTRSRAETRLAIGVAVDAGAERLGADDAERVALGDDVQAAVLEAYPPPEC